MAKEFDIYLNNRLTQCDIIVYSIPYRDGLTVMNRIILESCLENYLLQKFVAMQTSHELVAHIDKMIKVCNEKLSVGMAIGANAELSTSYAVSPKDASIIIGQNDVALTALSSISVNSAVVLDAEPLLMLIGKSIGGGSSTIQIDYSLEKIIKNSIERFENKMELSAQVSGTFKKGVLSVESGLIPNAELTNLCYRVYRAGEAALQIAADVLGTEIHFSLGEGTSSMVIGSDVGDGDRATKYESAQNQLVIFAELTDTLQQFMTPDAAPVELAMEAQPIVKRHRLLSEMDGDTLASFDGMTLEEVDYVIIQP